MKREGVVRSLTVLLLLTASVCLTAYPFLSNYVFEHRADSLAREAERSVGRMTDSERQAAIEAAVEYNRNIAEGNVELGDPFLPENQGDHREAYHSLLSVSKDGMMGYLEIPSIGVSLPIYHGVSEKVLQKGVGHLEGTSLPVGGESTHAVLTGHTGLSHAKLFTDLEELEEEELFRIKVMGEELVYQVKRIEVVRPEDVDALYVETGRDLCTLVTCTPYGVNSHRLFVHGERIACRETRSSPAVRHDGESQWMAEYRRALKISLACLVVCLTIWRRLRLIRKKNHHLRRKEN